MTLAQHAAYQVLAAKKNHTDAEEKTMWGYRQQYASETLVGAFPSGDNGAHSSGSDKS